MTRKKAYIPFELVKKIVRENPQIRSYGLNDWGEPLLHPQFLEIVKYLKDSGKSVFFATNATLLDEKMATELVRLKVDSIWFSMDGVFEDYERIRGVSYELVKGNILRFLDMAKEAGHKVVTFIVATVGEDSEKGIKRLRKEWSGKMPVLTQPKLLFTKDDRKGACAQLFMDHLVVLSDGKVIPCCADYEGRLEIGDAWENTLTEIINGEKMNALRRDSSGTFCDYCSEYDSREAVPRFKVNPHVARLKTIIRNVSNR
jgi:hypothetical protein